MKRERKLERATRRRRGVPDGSATPDRERPGPGEGERRTLSDDELSSVAGGRDVATGLPTGQRMHKPYTLT